ncbi:MAG: CarD family transcriptional regulator [Lachnospiraceae bacterium]|nr:CarD family transcriptional regulator [Lachnospiraceae bacterium]
MFEIGEYVVYGNKGVCKVSKIGPIDIPGMSKERQYYTLSQVYTRGSTIFTPVDNDKGVLRRILTPEEAKELIDEAADMNPVWIQNDKEREQKFTETLRSADTRSLFEMIIALYHRKERRLADGKKATSTDERYFHAAEDILYGELGVSLGIGKDEVKDFIIKEFETVR